MDYDDGFVAYLNGMEVVRENMGEPGTEVLPSDLAMTNVEANIYRGLKPEKFFVENVAEYLVDGQNILSIQVHNANENLADLTALPILSFITQILPCQVRPLKSPLEYKQIAILMKPLGP